jgi:hypothetical protein
VTITTDSEDVVTIAAPDLAKIQRDALAALRQAFPPERVGLLPRITCKDCRDARGKVCDRHNKSKCGECGAYITSSHIHLDYVGHGAVTERLLDVDLTWNWEPLAFDQSGMPTMVYDDKGNPISFWIRLTVAGMTRLGVGTCESGQVDAEKVLIGDALRNAAMRFGVALGLWIKGHAEDDERTAAEADRRPDRGGQSTQRPEPEPAVDPEQVTREDTQPYVDQVRVLSETARASFIEAWRAVIDDDGTPLLPTTEKDDGTVVPSFGRLRRAQLPVVEALLMKAKRVPVDGEALDRATEAATETDVAASEAASGETVQAAVGGEEEGHDWAEESRGLAEVMQTSRSMLAPAIADGIAAEIWDLHHATLNKQLDEAGEPARPGEPIDLRRMRLAILRFENENEEPF